MFLDLDQTVGEGGQGVDGDAGDDFEGLFVGVAGFAEVGPGFGRDVAALVE